MSQARPSSVLDALIATKWYLNDEEYTAEAQQLLTGFGEGIITLFAPDHIRYEVGNALWRAVQRDRFDVEFSRQALAGFLTLGVHTIGSNALIRAAFDLAVQYGCTLYNGLYLALAADSGLSLVHADTTSSLAGSLMSSGSRITTRACERESRRRRNPQS